MKQFLIFLFCVVTGYTFAQEKVFEIETPFLDLRSYEKNTIKLTNQETNDIVFLLQEKKQIKALLIDQNYNLKKTITIAKFPKKLNVLLGYNITDGQYHLFYSNTRFKKSAVLTLDFNTQTHHIKEVTYNIKGEHFLDSFIHNNKVYLCTITKHSNTLNFYDINDAFELQKKKEVTLNNVIYRSLNPSNDYYFLSDVFNGDYVNHHKILTHTKIDEISQHSLKETSKLIKFYPNSDHLFLVFDVDKTVTQIFEFDWDTFEGISKIFPKPLMENKSPYQRTNSFFFDNKLFQIVTHPKEMQLLIKDYTTNETLKVYQASKKDSIDFKNSAIIVEEKNDISLKESKTSRFLRYMSQKDLGIYAQKINDQYVLTYGGVKIKEDTREAAITFGFSPLPFLNIHISIPVFTFTDFSSFNYLNTVYIKSVFSPEFEHEDIPVPPNSQDKLLVYNKKEVKKLPAKIIFEHNNSLHFGYYDLYRKKFIVFRF
ncbi:hypothetical protein [Aquimarina rhabdastrellae]